MMREKKILDDNFSSKAYEILKVFEPIIKIMFVDGNGKPTVFNL